MPPAFALIHLLIGRPRVLDAVPRSRWLSFAGGVAVTCVFLHILPELGGHEQTFAEGLGVGEYVAKAFVYLIALTGLAAFYRLERAAKTSRRRSRRRDGREEVEPGIFWLHMGS